jgi:hypothetical protein
MPMPVDALPLHAMPTNLIQITMLQTDVSVIMLTDLIQITVLQADVKQI